MGRSLLLGAFCCSLLPLLAQTPPTPLRPLPGTLPEIVLAADDADGLVVAAGLGDGGIPTTTRGDLQWSDDGCVTPGGVRISVRTVGVKLTFPSGTELLLAADGHLHLRSGERGGPFPGGVELRLGDGSIVRVTLAQSNAVRVRDVVVLAGDRMLQPWRRGEEATELPRRSAWAGVHLAVCGSGGDVYRAIALGPLVVLDRVLVAEARTAVTPEQRLVVLRSPLVRSLSVMQRQHREPKAELRQAIAAVAAVAERGDTIFPAGAALQRAEHDRLRWLLAGGFELELDLDGPLAPRLQLFAGMSPLPMIEWTARADSAAFLTNPRSDQRDQRWHGNGTRLDRVAVDLQAREELFELAYALRVIQRLLPARRR